jgi:hypothetical protein
VFLEEPIFKTQRGKLLLFAFLVYSFSFVLLGNALVNYSSHVDLVVVGPEVLRPTGAGSVTEWSSNLLVDNWQCLNEVNSDDDSSYVYSSNLLVNQTDFYSIQSHTVGFGTITNVTVWMRSRASDVPAGLTPPMQLMLKTHSTEFQADPISLTTTYTNYAQSYPVNPQTGIAWTWSEIDTLEVGIRGSAIQVDSSTANPTCTQIWIEVNYHP